MSEHINEWLGAYSDGELRGAQLIRVENHLGECAQCQAELALLRRLSSVLRESAPSGDFLSTERFIANLNLNLPRRLEKQPARKALEICWWLIPFAVLGVWGFVQVTFALSAVALNAADTGLLGSSLAGQGAVPVTEWFSLLTNLFGSQIGLAGQTVLFNLNNAEVFIQGLLDQVILQALLAVVYLGWLAAWWSRQSTQLSNPGSMDFSA